MSVISPNTLIKRYLGIIFSYTTINIFLDESFLFTSFLLTHENRSIYKSDTITSAIKFIEN